MTIIKTPVALRSSMRIKRKAAGTLRKSFVCVPREKGNISRVQSVAILGSINRICKGSLKAHEFIGKILRCGYVLFAVERVRRTGGCIRDSERAEQFQSSE